MHELAEVLLLAELQLLPIVVHNRVEKSERVDIRFPAKEHLCKEILKFTRNCRD